MQEYSAGREDLTLVPTVALWTVQLQPLTLWSLDRVSRCCSRCTRSPCRLRTCCWAAARLLCSVLTCRPTARDCRLLLLIRQEQLAAQAVAVYSLILVVKRKTLNVSTTMLSLNASAWTSTAGTGYWV